MMIEQEMVIMKASDLEEYQAKHGEKEPAPIVQFFSASVPTDDFYKEKIKCLEKENETLRGEISSYKDKLADVARDRDYKLNCCDNARTAREAELNRRIEELMERCVKLEKAIVEAAIR